MVKLLDLILLLFIKMKNNMDYLKERFPLNYFLFWSKSWFTVTSGVRLEEQLRPIFFLDGYGFAKTIDEQLKVLLSVLDDYNNWLIKNGTDHLTFTELLCSVIKIKRDYKKKGDGLSVQEATVLAIGYFFRYTDCSHFCITFPTFCRKLRRMGVVGRSCKNGRTYKQQNDAIMKIFNIKPSEMEDVEFYSKKWYDWKKHL